MRAFLKQHFPRVDKLVDQYGYWAPFIGTLWGGMTWAASSISSISQYGWGAVVFAGLGVVCVGALVISVAMALFATSYRKLWPLPVGQQMALQIGLPNKASAEVELNQPQAAKWISDLRFVSSDPARIMSLVVTPAQGGCQLGVFVDLSHWRTSISSAKWSQPERLFLGDVQLQAPNLKFSLVVIEKTQPDIQPKGWLWKCLNSRGEPSGMQPCFIHGKLRAVFVFIDAQGQEQRFPFLLLKEFGNPEAAPIVVTSEDLPTKIS